MASEFVMYISVLAIGVLTIAGVTITFNALNTNTIESTIEVGLYEVSNTIANELKNVLELGINTDPLTAVTINRSLVLPTQIAGHFYEANFKTLPGAKHWFIEIVDTTDSSFGEFVFETTIPWRNVTLVNKDNTGLPLIDSFDEQHMISFVRLAGLSSFRIYLW